MHYLVAGIVLVGAVAYGIDRTAKLAENAGDAIEQTGDASLQIAGATIIASGAYLALKKWG